MFYDAIGRSGKQDQGGKYQDQVGLTLPKVD
jgi:hypothetical protein